MKRVVLVITAISLMLNVVCATGQVKGEEKEETTKVTEVNSSETVISIGDDRMKVESSEDITTVRLGSRIVTITSGEKGPKMNIEKIVRDEDIPDQEMLTCNEGTGRYDDGHSSYPSRFRFRPHWSGFEFGFNNYLATGYESTLPDEYNFMDLNTGKSFNVNINFGQLGIGFTRHFGMVTGMGLQFNDYVFEGNNNLMKDENGVIVEYDAGVDGLVLDKSKLSTTYFVMPLLFELQIPVDRHNTINIAAGMIGGAKIASRTKMVYHDDGKQKIKEKNDYSLNLLRYGPTVRLGYESFQVYATYYMNGLFKENKGPELYPVQIGVAFTLD
ncbi:MAG: PorT family protein [Bacteroidales bacterium]|nr:PorT family protein [Bacteroidales bacterium]